MIKTLCKKAKGNKGFTLIEVIVVLAILAVLALIIVPRLGGFTKQAKEDADNATAKTIETAVMSLMATSRIKGKGYIEIKNPTSAGDKSTITSSGLTLTVSDLEELIGDKVQCQTGTGFKITVDTDTQSITVEINKPTTSTTTDSTTTDSTSPS